MKKDFPFGLGLVLTALMVFSWFAGGDHAQSATVTVSASVTSTITCNTNISSSAFGALTSLAVATSTPNASTSLSCNTGLGCTLSVSDAGNAVNGGLATSSPAYLIPSPASGFPTTATLAAGTEGYGIQATTTAAGSGGTLSLNSIYNPVTSFSGTTVGRLSVSTVTLASSTVGVSGREVVVRHLAAISATTQAGSYADTLTYSCTAN